MFNGRVRTYFPATIICNLSAPGYITAEPMAGAGGASVSRFLSIDGGPAVNGPRWDNIVGQHTLHFTGGKPGVEYAIGAWPL